MKTTKEIKEFLSESNKIEEVYDKDSLQQAIYAWEYLIKQKSLTAGVILRTHKILMLHQNLLPNEKGYFRTQQVWIGFREGLRWEKIPLAIDQWVLNVKDLLKNKTKEDSQRTLERIIKDHHVKYEHIHGFMDGNGRTGRMFMNWERIQVGLPILIIKAKERQKYYKWF